MQQLRRMALDGLRVGLLAALCLLADPAAMARDTGVIAQSRLPAEARATLSLIKRGGPYPYRQDHGVFGNRERLLPARPRGYYREYTVPTPGVPHRGARRIVAGGSPPEVFYYTDDHYRSFRVIQREQREQRDNRSTP